MRAFVDLWDEITEKRYGVKDPALRRFRYGVQVNSLGLTEQQPENNVYRILLSMLAVTLSKKARARAVQLPAWNEALGLPTPWDQQWSLRLQQIVAFETDLLEYGDIFDGSGEIDRKVEELKGEARAELAKIQAMGGAVAAIDYMKEALIASNAARVAAIEKGEQVLVGVNAYTETEPSPLASTGIEGILTVPESVEIEQVAALQAWRQRRDDKAVRQALTELKARRPRAATSCRLRSRQRRPASPPANGARSCAKCSANIARRPASTPSTSSTRQGSRMCAARWKKSRAASAER